MIEPKTVHYLNKNDIDKNKKVEYLINYKYLSAGTIEQALASYRDGRMDNGYIS